MKSSITLFSLLVLLQWVEATGLKTDLEADIEAEIEAGINAGLNLGDNLETTLNKLGKPVGMVELREKTLLLYPKGEVVLKDDAIVEIDLISEAEYAAEQAQLQNERQEWQIEKAKRAAARTEEGESILAAKRGSSAFAALPAKARVDYWRNFQIQYPQVDASSELSRALESYQTELAELRTQQQIAQLQTRVAEAEKEAATARLETRKLKDAAQRSREPTRYGLRYYYDPVVHPRYIYRPPTVTIFSNGTVTTTHQQKPDYRKFRTHNSNSTAERIARIIRGKNLD